MGFREQKNAPEESSSVKVTLHLPGDKLPPQDIYFYVDMDVETDQLYPQSLTAKE